MRIMPEAKRFLSQFGLRSFVEFVFVVQRGFLQILPVDLAQKKKNKKKKKEILRSNETGIIGTKKNKQESSSNFVITTWALSFSSVGSIRWIKIENLKGKKSNSRVYQKNFISDNEREFLSVQLSPPWFIEDLDEERAIVSIESPLARLFFFFVPSSPSIRRWRIPSLLATFDIDRGVRARRWRGGKRGKSYKEKNGEREWNGILRENAEKRKEGEERE